MLEAAGLFWLVYFAVYLFYIQTEKPSKGHKGTKTEGEQDIKPNLACVTSSLLGGYTEGFLQGNSLFWTNQLFTVHSAVSSTAKKTCGHTASPHCKRWQRLLFRRDSIQRWPTGSGISGETICFNQRRASAFLLDTVPLYSTSRLGRADAAWLGCWRSHGPGEALKSLMSYAGFWCTFTSAPPRNPGLP